MNVKYLGKTLLFLTALSLALPISALVKYIHIHDDGLTVPTIEVFQSEFPDGTLRSTTLKARSYLSPWVNPGVKIEVKCKRGYELGVADLKNANNVSTQSCRPD